MTFPELCRHFQARRVGKGKYQAKCPAHRDSKPSLSIREGRDAALIKCWAGCELRDVVKAAGLSLKDIWYASLEDPRAIAKIKSDREAEEALTDLVREAKRYREYRRQQWVKVATALAWLVFRHPSNIGLTEAYEYALDCSGGDLTTWHQIHPDYSPFPPQKLLHGLSLRDVTPQIARYLKLPA